MRRIFFALLIMGFAFVRCGTVDHAEIESAQEEAVSFSSILRGNSFSVGSEGLVDTVLVIHSEKEWKNLTETVTNTTPNLSKIEITDLDFTLEMMVVIFDKVHPTAGYEIQAESIKKTKDQMLIQLNKKHPSEMAADVMTQPFEILRMKKQDLKIVVE